MAVWRLSYLSLIVTHLHSLPGIRKDVCTQHEEYASLLASVPPRPSQPPPVALLQLITQYVTELDTLIYGGPQKKQMIQKSTEAYGRFRVAVRDTAPVFRSKTRSENSSKRGTQEKDVDSGDSDGENDASK